MPERALQVSSRPVKVLTAGVLLAMAGVAQAGPPKVGVLDAAAGGSGRVFAETPGSLEFSGQLIVRPKQGMSASFVAAARAGLEGRVLKYYPEVDEYVVDVRGVARAGARGEGENELAAALMATGLYQYAVPNWICYPLETVPNDPLYASQWHHQVMRSALAWDISTGLEPLIVAVTDTGIDLSHEDLAGKRVLGFDAFADMAEADGGSVADINGHGTHVAGCAVAAGNNGVGVAGVNWDSRIMMIRVALDGSGSAYYDDLLQGARWAIENGAKTVSASYSGIGYDPIQTTGEYIASIGGIYFYAAGNDQRNLSGFDFNDVVVVGATDEADGKAWFSAYGLGVDIFAPGVNILSSCNGGGYCGASGTSMATPVANGVASVIWSINPNLTPAQVKSILYTSCIDFGAPGNDDYWGWGRVDLLNAAAAAAGTLGPAAPTATDDDADTIEGLALRIDVMANDYDINGDSFGIDAFDAATGNGGVVSRSVGTGPDGRDELVYTPAPGFVGNDTFGYTLRDSTGRTGSGVVRMRVLDGAQFRDPDDVRFTEAGVRVSYYVTAGYSLLPNFAALTPYASGVVPNIDYPSVNGAYAGSGRADEVGAVYEGVLVIDRPGFYDLFTNSDDGSRLWVGSTMVVDNDGLHGMVERSGRIGLKPGLHRVRVEFWENFGGAGLIVSVAGPGLSKRVVPPAMFAYEVCGADFNGDGFIDFFDLDAYVGCFDGGSCPAGRSADYNADGFVDFFDLDEFIASFESGC
ncbi:MAG: S8 family serine peptidase [Phycisphaeraceae bacterium]|nr:MAG: S8 family serine peptidase [Phycisphaeraceae bacterium]